MTTTMRDGIPADDSWDWKLEVAMVSLQYQRAVDRLGVSHHFGAKLSTFYSYIRLQEKVARLQHQPVIAGQLQYFADALTALPGFKQRRTDDE